MDLDTLVECECCGTECPEYYTNDDGLCLDCSGA
jgi:hypothetical protein